MNNVLRSMRSCSLTLSTLSLFVAAFFMPFSEACKVTFIIFVAAFALTRLVHLPRLTWRKPSRATLPLYLIIAFFLWVTITMFWTGNTDEGFHVLSKRLTILVVPLLALLRVPGERYDYNKVLFTLFLGVLVMSVLRFFISIPTNLDQDFEQLRLQWVWTYRGDFPNRWNMQLIHPTIMGVLQCYAIAALAYLKRPLFIKGKKSTALYYIFFAAVYALFLFLIYASLARMALIIFFAVSAIVVIVYLWNRHHRKIMFAAIALITIAGAAVLLNNPRMENFEWKKMQEFDPRYEQWRCGFMAISENNPIIGVGVGDGTYTFNAVHARPTFAKYFFDVESAHCIWIDGTLEFGIIGCLLLLAFFITNCLHFKRREQQIFMLTFTAIWILYTLTEPFLSRFAPIYIFCLTLLISFWMKEDSDTDKK